MRDEKEDYMLMKYDRERQSCNTWDYFTLKDHFNKVNNSVWRGGFYPFTEADFDNFWNSLDTEGGKVTTYTDNELERIYFHHTIELTLKNRALRLNKERLATTSLTRLVIDIDPYEIESEEARYLTVIGFCGELKKGFCKFDMENKAQKKQVAFLTEMNNKNIFNNGVAFEDFSIEDVSKVMENLNAKLKNVLNLNKNVFICRNKTIFINYTECQFS